MTLDEVKVYLKLDDDLTEDDELITGLIDAAKTYIEDSTGKSYQDTQLYNLAVKMIVAHWYENRQVISNKTVVNELPQSFFSIVAQIQWSSRYTEVVSHD